MLWQKLFFLEVVEEVGIIFYNDHLVFGPLSQERLDNSEHCLKEQVCVHNIKTGKPLCVIVLQQTDEFRCKSHDLFVKIFLFKASPVIYYNYFLISLSFTLLNGLLNHEHAVANHNIEVGGRRVVKARSDYHAQPVLLVNPINYDLLSCNMHSYLLHIDLVHLECEAPFNPFFVHLEAFLVLPVPCH